MPALIVRGWLIGGGLGAALSALLVITNTAGLRDLVQQSADGIVAVVLLMFGFVTLFAGLYSGASVMLVPRGGDGDRGD